MLRYVVMEIRSAMNILLIDNSSLTPYSGALCCENKTGQFAAELKRLGNRVTMFGQVVEKENTVHAFNLEKNGIDVIGTKRKKNKIINYLVLYTLIVPKIMKADFVYIFYPSAFKYASVLCWLLRTPYGVYIRGEQDLQSQSSKWIYKKSFVIFTVTDYFTQMVNKITNKNTAYSIRPMIPLTEKDLVVDRNYIAKEHYTILFLARMESDKGVEELLKAVKLLKQENYSFTLDLVGDGAYLPQARKLIEQLDITDVVVVKGAVLDPAQVRQLYLDADLYVLPTYHEGFPRTLYEAMIFGTPIITTFVGGIPGVMLAGHNCLEIRPKSVESIVDTVEYAINNYSELAECAKNASGTVVLIIDSDRLSHAAHLTSILNILI